MSPSHLQKEIQRGGKIEREDERVEKGRNEKRDSEMKEVERLKNPVHNVFRE